MRNLIFDGIRDHLVHFPYLTHNRTRAIEHKCHLLSSRVGLWQSLTKEKKDLLRKYFVKVE